jgi:hypothetical protein
VLDMRLTIDDHVAFQRYCLERRPHGRRDLLRTRLLVVGAMALLTFVLDSKDSWQHGWLSVAVTGVLAVGFWLLLPSMGMVYFRHRMLREIRGGAENVSRLWLDERGLNDQAASGQLTHYPWSTIEGIDETPTHAFIWVGATTAVVIPQGIGHDAVRAFLGAVKVACTQARYATPPGYGVSGR